MPVSGGSRTSSARSSPLSVSLMRTVGIHHNQPTYQVDGDALGYAVHTALRLGMKEMDAVARTAITSAFNRAAIRPIRSEF